MIQHSLGVSAP